jgi:succinoglycan biosynthesis transport protein ExoP
LNLPQFLFIFRARYKVALFIAFLTIVLGVAVSELSPKQYTAETSVMVDIRSADPVSSLLGPATMMPYSLGTQIDIINSDRVSRKVVKILRLEENASLKNRWLAATAGRGKLDDWIGNLLQRGVKVTPSRDSNLITISFRGSDPAFVAAVANGYAQAYIEASIELKVEPARQYSRWFGEQAKLLRENVEKAQARLSEFQQSTGIVGTDEARDYELAKLNELVGKLTALQVETRDAETKLRSPSSTMDVLPEVVANPVVSGLRTDIARQEGKLKEAALNFGGKHPQYLRMESELAELKLRLEAEKRLVTSGYSSTSVVGKSREADLRAAIEAQKKKLLDLKRERDEIAVLVRDVDTAKRAYEAVTTRLNQSSLESQATQTNVSVLTPALEPLEPSFPKPLQQTLLLAIVLGIALGAAAAFALEMLDRRVRSAQDLAEMLPLPVLGTIAGARQPGRLALLHRGTALLGR